MYAQVLTILSLAVTLAYGLVGDGRIVDGFLTTFGHVPYLMQLRHSDNRTFCGGTLVDPTHVVTAAHCLEGIDYKEVVVVGNATMRTDPGVQRHIAQAISHPLYNKDVSLNHDIAVLKLSSPMKGWPIKSLPLCSKAVPDGASLVVAGLGMFAKRQYSPQIRAAFVKKISREECEQFYGAKELTSSMMCTHGGGKSSFGDSGGPAYYNKQLCGVVSWGRMSSVTSYPSVFTDVLSEMDFLRSALNN